MTDNRELIGGKATDEETRQLLDYINRQDFNALDDYYEQIFAPFSYFGGKRLNVVPVWCRYGVDIPNYIESFSGSAAIFYGRPPNISGRFRRELLNDECRLLINAYRAIKYADPADLAEICQEIYAEDELIAWNKELIRNRRVLRDKIQDDVRYYDLELAGRWVWLTRGWIGAGACDAAINVKSKIPRSRIAGWYRNSPVSHFRALKSRLAETQLNAGGYDRALVSFTQTENFGMTAVFFDPPYPPGFCSKTYAYQSQTVAWESFEMALQLGANPAFRVAYCGYKSIFGRHFAAAGWEAVPCRNLGGFGNQAEDGRGRSNRRDEFIWFSPFCLKP